MPAWEDVAGIHYVKDPKAVKRAGPVEKCMGANCSADAVCMPRLYVPAHPMSIVRDQEDVSALMGVKLCDRCFYLLKPGQFLRHDEVRATFAAEFQKRNGVPNFDKAVIGRIPIYDPDFAKMEEIRQKARQN